MNENTPGPWKAVEIDDGIFSIVGHPKWPCTRFGVKGEWDVAEVEQLENRDEALANARLIAAAPDLLEASKKAVEFIEEFYPNAAFNGHTASLRLAISKAEPSQSATIVPQGGKG